MTTEIKHPEFARFSTCCTGSPLSFSARSMLDRWSVFHRVGSPEKALTEAW